MKDKRMQFRTCDHKTPHAEYSRSNPYGRSRSPSRPCFIEGGARSYRSCGASRQVRASATHDQVWIASSDAVLRADPVRLLTGDDWRSLDRIRTPFDRDSAVAARVLLRLGLSADRRIEPMDWEFARTARSGRAWRMVPQIHYSVCTPSRWWLSRSPRRSMSGSTSNPSTGNCPTP